MPRRVVIEREGPGGNSRAFLVDESAFPGPKPALNGRYSGLPPLGDLDRS